MTRPLAVVGKKVIRKDAVAKAKGQARYISDIILPKMLYASFLRSPHAHARIKSIDTARAEALPGVMCVLTHKNVPKVHPFRKLMWLLSETVHYPGEEVAAVAALTPEIAKAALDLIEVQYEVLEAVVEPRQAAAPGAPLSNIDYGSAFYHGTDYMKFARVEPDGWVRVGFGDYEKGFAEADHIMEFEMETPMQYNCSPNPRSVVCEWDGDKLICWADTQLPLFLMHELTKTFEIPQSQVRIIASHAVGGYGGKSPEKTADLVALMAKRTGRPVRAVYSRAEDYIGTHHRISYVTKHKIGFKNDGTIVSMYTNILANWGCDAVAHFVCQASALLDACCMFYRWQNAFAETRGVLTNMLEYGAMNGFGDPEAIYSIEVLMDKVCEHLDIDPVEFRLKNCMRYGDRAMEYENILFGPIEWGILGRDMDSFPEIIQTAAERFNWKERWRGWHKKPDAGEIKRGVGMAVGQHHCMFWPSSAIVKMNQDGSANVITGAVEIGQGYATAVAQVVAEALCIPYEKVHVLTQDSAATPATKGNVASTGTSSPIAACKIAADDVVRQLKEFAGIAWSTNPDKLEVYDDAVHNPVSGASMSVEHICKESWQITGVGKTPAYHEIKDPESGKTVHAFAAACTFCEVEVDTGTGKITILNLVSGHDSGRTINPVVIENQVDLGLIMAMGWVLTENYLVDPETGVLMNPNLLDYKLIGFNDMPLLKDFERFIVEKPCEWGPFGAKGMSETSMTAMGPAIANAIYNATGVRMNTSHFTPDKVLEELLKKDC